MPPSEHGVDKNQPCIPQNHNCSGADEGLKDLGCRRKGFTGCPAHGWDGDAANEVLEGSLRGCFLEDRPLQEA